MKKPNSSWVLAGAVLGTAAFAGGAAAQDGGLTDSIEATIGAGVQSVPEYLGSKDNEVDWLPILDVTYDNSLFFAIENEVKTNFVLGYNFIRNPNLRVAAFGKYRDGRDAEDSADLTTALEVDDSVEIGVLAEYAFDFVKLDMKVAYDVGGGHDGFLAEAGVAFGAKLSPQLQVQARAGATYANEDYMQSYYATPAGFNNTTSAYNPEASVRDVNLGVSATYRFSNNWGLLGYAQVMYLLDEASNSPLVDGVNAVGDNEQFFAGLALTYTF